MRILLTVKHFGYGGAENHMRELANALAVRGHRVWVAAPPGRQAALLHRSVEHVPVSYSDLAREHPAFELHIHGDGPALPALLVRVAEANRAAVAKVLDPQQDTHRFARSRRSGARRLLLSYGAGAAGCGALEDSW
jgi:hypothetical protein